MNVISVQSDFFTTRYGRSDPVMRFKEVREKLGTDAVDTYQVMIKM